MTQYSMNFDFNKACFTYFISMAPHPLFGKHYEFSGLYINHTAQTSVLIEQTELYGQGICIIGLCVDAFSEIERRDIPKYLLENSGANISLLIERTKRLAGKYIILYKTQNELYAFGDATGTLSIFYNTLGEICLSSCDELIRKHFNYPLSEKSVHIRNKANYLDPLPNDITLCDNVKILLPNHFLSVRDNGVARYYPTPNSSHNQNIDVSIERCIQLIDNITGEYKKYYADVTCPLTSGKDSRLNLAFMRRHYPELTCYTFNHPTFTENTGDYYVPKQICELTKMKYSLITDITPPEEYMRALKEIIGEYHSEYTISLAYTFNSAFYGKALFGGDIIDQIGKSLIGGNIPEFFATARYFATKHHNYSRDILIYIEDYIDEAKKNKFCFNIYDLFAIEIRIGRWAAQREMIYSIAGITSLNIYNCWEVIERWMNIPRKIRTANVIHYKMYNNLDPQLLTIPFNPSDKTKLAKNNALFFLIATYVKYFMHYLKHR